MSNACNKDEAIAFIVMRKKWEDPVVEEVRERGRKVFERFDHDPAKVMAYLRKLQTETPERFVSEVVVIHSKITSPAAGEKA